ncbi:hypothetical protein HYFRA_00006157 [Hymenoscyphus fraxineus]|uniref:Homeobox domain-containing protein n=1 Tax=Hymenoscyphus fraxineus TaxID=746836 RepID=A0A9N9LCC1_9HELO|nr:hypothetical protein HYFRA_00006157 [Hymenoscyphus fraxineus]
MPGPFAPSQEKALKESYARDCNPTIGETILLVHTTGLEKLQVTRWFGRRRSEARGRGEELKTVNAEKNGRTAHSMWARYRRDPEGYVERLRSGRIDLVDGGETGKGGGEDGGDESGKEKDDGGEGGAEESGKETGENEKDDEGGEKGVKDEEDEEELQDPLEESGVDASVEDSPDQ